MGASTLTYAQHERIFGHALMPRLVSPGTTVGQAMTEAKAEVAGRHPYMLDVIVGWNLLVDPTLSLSDEFLTCHSHNRGGVHVACAAFCVPKQNVIHMARQIACRVF